MKRSLALSIILMGQLSVIAPASANDDSTYVVTVTQSSEPEIDDGPVRHRTPSRPILCTISSDGVSIPCVNTDDIISYEVYNLDGSCLAVFTSEADFIAYIYNVNVTVEIRLHTYGYVFHGYLYL